MDAEQLIYDKFSARRSVYTRTAYHIVIICLALMIAIFLPLHASYTHPDPGELVEATPLDGEVLAPAVEVDSEELIVVQSPDNVIIIMSASGEHAKLQKGDPVTLWKTPAEAGTGIRAVTDSKAKSFTTSPSTGATYALTPYIAAPAPLGDWPLLIGALASFLLLSFIATGAALAGAHLKSQDVPLGIRTNGFMGSLHHHNSSKLKDITRKQIALASMMFVPTTLFSVLLVDAFALQGIDANINKVGWLIFLTFMFGLLGGVVQLLISFMVWEEGPGVAIKIARWCYWRHLGDGPASYAYDKRESSIIKAYLKKSYWDEETAEVMWETFDGTLDELITCVEDLGPARK